MRSTIYHILSLSPKVPRVPGDRLSQMSRGSRGSRQGSRGSRLKHKSYWPQTILMPAFQIFARYSFLKQKPYVRRSAKYLSMMAEVSSCNLDNYFTNNMIKLMFDFFVEILSFEIEYNKHEEKSNTNSWYNWKILFRQKPQKRSELVSE